MKVEWTLVKDALPEFGVPVLLTDGKVILVGTREAAQYREYTGRPGWVWSACGISGYEWDWEFDDYRAQGIVTHWAPMVELPEK